jgi:hypothetical protein
MMQWKLRHWQWKLKCWQWKLRYWRWKIKKVSVHYGPDA